MILRRSRMITGVTIIGSLVGVFCLLLAGLSTIEIKKPDSETERTIPRAGRDTTYLDIVRPESPYSYVFLGTVIKQEPVEPVLDGEILPFFVPLLEVTFRVDEILRGNPGEEFVCREANLITGSYATFTKIGQQVVVAADEEKAILHKNATAWPASEDGFVEVTSNYRDGYYPYGSEKYGPDAPFSGKMKLEEFLRQLKLDIASFKEMQANMETLQTFGPPEVEVIDVTSDFATLRVQAPKEIPEWLWGTVKVEQWEGERVFVRHSSGGYSEIIIQVLLTYVDIDWADATICVYFEFGYDGSQYSKVCIPHPLSDTTQ